MNSVLLAHIECKIGELYCIVYLDYGSRITIQNQKPQFFYHSPHLLPVDWKGTLWQAAASSLEQSPHHTRPLSWELLNPSWHHHYSMHARQWFNTVINRLNYSSPFDLWITFYLFIKCLWPSFPFCTSRRRLAILFLHNLLKKSHQYIIKARVHLNVLLIKVIQSVLWWLHVV